MFSLIVVFRCINKVYLPRKCPTVIVNSVLEATKNSNYENLQITCYFMTFISKQEGILYPFDF